MGFSINYRSTRPVNPKAVTAIDQTTENACRDRTWLSCEPVICSADDDGYLCGQSKPNFQPHPDDVAAAAREGLPDGTARDMLDVLCRLSREYGIDWEISHDHSDGPIGLIQAGECDDEVLSHVEIFAGLAEMLGGIQDEFFGRGMDEESDDDAGPSIQPFRPKRD